MDFVIDHEIETLLPKLTPEEAEQLRLNITSSGRIDPLTVLVIGGKERVLGDGHHRLIIAEGEGIDYATIEVEVPDRAAAIQWVIDNQLGRRNLTDERRAYYRGKEYLLTKKADGNPQLGQNVQVGRTPKNTADSLAEKHGVDGRTIRRDAKFAEAVDRISEQQGNEAREQILSGQSGQTKKEIIAGSPILCDRCQRVGPTKDCKWCAEVQGRKPTPSPGQAKPRNLRMINVNWAEIDEWMKRARRVPDEIKKAFEGEGESEEYREAKQLLDAAVEKVRSWKRRLNRTI
jgi:hypothetical protein